MKSFFFFSFALFSCLIYAQSLPAMKTLRGNDSRIIAIDTIMYIAYGDTNYAYKSCTIFLAASGRTRYYSLFRNQPYLLSDDSCKKNCYDICIFNDNDLKKINSIFFYTKKKYLYSFGCDYIYKEGFQALPFTFDLFYLNNKKSHDKTMYKYIAINNKYKTKNKISKKIFVEEDIYGNSLYEFFDLIYYHRIGIIEAWYWLRPHKWSIPKKIIGFKLLSINGHSIKECQKHPEWIHVPY